MSKLAALGVGYSVISTSKGPLSFRGLSLVDVVRIVSTHGSAIVTLLAGFPPPKEDETIADYLKGLTTSNGIGHEAAMMALTTAPAVCHSLIAAAVDEPEDQATLDAASKLPVGLQVNLLIEIAKATFADAGGLKNVVEIVAKALAGAIPPPPQA